MSRRELCRWRIASDGKVALESRRTSLPTHGLGPSELLLRNLLLVFISSGSGRLADDVLDLAQEQLHVTGRAHVRVDPTVSTVRPSAHFRCAVNVDVLDDQAVNVELLFAGVSLGVLQQVQKMLCALLGPTTLRSLPGFALCVTANATVEPVDRNGFSRVRTEQASITGDGDSELT